MVDILEDVRGIGIIGAFVMQLDSPVKDRDGNEMKIFNAGVKNLTHAESRKMLAAKDEYIGRFATVEFFSLKRIRDSEISEAERISRGCLAFGYGLFQMPAEPRSMISSCL